MQVYRARLTPALGGSEIAIKVQRPALREAIALDLLLMRRVALFMRRFPEVGFHLVTAAPLDNSSQNLLYVLCSSIWYGSRHV